VAWCCPSAQFSSLRVSVATVSCRRPIQNAASMG